MSILKVGLVAPDSGTVWLCGRAGRCLRSSDQTRFVPDHQATDCAGNVAGFTIILCNYTNNTTPVVMLMALAFGKGFGALMAGT